MCYASIMPKGQHLNRDRQPKEVRTKALGVTALQPGEVSVNLRIRAPARIVELFAKLSPYERGEVVALGLRARGTFFASMPREVEERFMALPPTERSEVIKLGLAKKGE